jgi:hypothetical protein
MELARTLYLSAALSCAALSIFDSAWTESKRAILQSDDILEISTYSTDQVVPWVPLLQEWEEREFFHYPYLWVPPKGEISDNNVMLAREKNAQVIIVQHNGQVIGIAGAIVFDSEEMHSNHRWLLEKTIAHGFDPAHIVYVNYFLTAPQFRNDARLVSLMYNKLVDFTHCIGRTQICYLEDLGNLDSPLKPEHPVAIEPWGHVIKGFRSMMYADLTWPTLQPNGSVADQVHVSEFFIQDL